MPTKAESEGGTEGLLKWRKERINEIYRVLRKGKVKEALHKHFLRNSGECRSYSPNDFLVTLIRSSGRKPDTFKQNYVHSNIPTKLNISYFSHNSFNLLFYHYSLSSSQDFTSLYPKRLWTLYLPLWQCQFMLWRLLFLVRREIALQAIALILPWSTQQPIHSGNISNHLTQQSLAIRGCKNCKFQASVLVHLYQDSTGKCSFDLCPKP